MTNVLKLLVVILLVALLYSFPAYAQEARCNELGADCICSICRYGLDGTVSDRGDAQCNTC